MDRGHRDLALRHRGEVGPGLVALVAGVAVDPVQAPAAGALVDQRELVAVDALAEPRDLDAVRVGARDVDVQQRARRQRHVLELGHQPGRERRRHLEVECLCPTRKSSSSALRLLRDRDPRQPRTIASSAAATVPE